MALVWAAGIIWFAYDFASGEAQPNPGDNVLVSDAAGAPISTADENRIAQALGS